MILIRTKTVKFEFIPTLFMIGVAIETDFHYRNVAIAVPFFMLIFEFKKDWKRKLL